VQKVHVEVKPLRTEALHCALLSSFQNRIWCEVGSTMTAARVAMLSLTCLSLLLTVRPGSAEEERSSRGPLSTSYKLPLHGNYGNASGCNALTDKEPVSDDMTYLTPDEYKGWEWGGGFAFAYESASDEDNKDWTVILACGGEGESYSSLVSISEQKSPQGGQFTVTITENDKSTTLQLCQ
jgi:hypothetical protein